ncbi:MAG: glutamine--fructose-6-phosphate transaminase (isomerizing) [Bacteroidales bacterium]
MCGIVGYIGQNQAYPILLQGLKRLEYRGYDSAGLALIDGENHLNVYKAKGKVSELEQFSLDKNIAGTIGIAHTRWATHGEPSSLNAHPHYSESESLALIHNGIIENYAALKTMLIEKGYHFRSRTDTEVLVHLIDYIRDGQCCDLLTAVRVALCQVVGSYAIALLDRDNPDQIIAARKSSPLVVGIGEDAYYLASDVSPIVEFTKEVIYLKEEEVVVIDRIHGIKVVTLENCEQQPEVVQIEMTLAQLEKGGFPHFMLKEIFEQPQTLRNCMRGRINVEGTNVTLSAVIDHKERLLAAKRVIIVACGTSWHAGLIGESLIESMCRLPVEVEYASEFRDRNPVIHEDDLVIALSQSGETADTLAAVELALSQGAFVYGICNVVGASIPRMTHTGSYIHVGPEIGVASTKAFSGQVTVLAMLALTLAKEKGLIEDGRLQSCIEELISIPGKIEKVLSLNDSIKNLSIPFTFARNFIYLGRVFSYPVALEGALKLKEISYIHAEGYPAAEMKHGPIALIDADMPVIVLATRSSTYDKVVSNVQEIKARNGRVIAIVTEGDELISELADYTISIPATVECLDPLLSVIPLQLLAYHIAVNKGRDVDQPRNLAKSVTVE